MLAVRENCDWAKYLCLGRSLAVCWLIDSLYLDFNEKDVSKHGEEMAEQIMWCGYPKKVR